MIKYLYAHIYMPGCVCFCGVFFFHEKLIREGGCDVSLFLDPSMTVIIILSCFVEFPFLTDRKALSALQKHMHTHLKEQQSLMSIRSQAHHSFISSGRGYIKRLEDEKMGFLGFVGRMLIVRVSQAVS